MIGIIPVSAIIEGACSDLGLGTDGVYRILAVQKGIGELPLTAAAENVLAQWPVDDEGVPQAPVPFSRGYAAIVDMRRVVHVRGLYPLDESERFGLAIGKYEQVFTKQGYIDVFTHNKSIPKSAARDVLRFVFNLRPTQTGTGWDFSPLGAVPNLFGPQAVTRTGLYEYTLERLREKEEARFEKAEQAGKKVRPSKYPLEAQAYFNALKFALRPYFPEKKEIKKERFRSPGTRAAPGITGGSFGPFIEREVVRPTISLPLQPYTLARRILKETTDPAIRSFAEEEYVALGGTKEIVDPHVLVLLERHGVEPPPRPGAGASEGEWRVYYQQLNDRLRDLERSLQLNYQHEVPKGEPYNLLRSSAESPELFEDLVSRLNPRARKPRKPRKERRRRGAAYNPIEEQSYHTLVDWAEKPEDRRGEPPDNYDSWLQPVRKLVEASPLGRLGEILTDRGKKSDFTLKAKGPALNQGDFLAHLTDYSVPADVEARLADKPEFYRDSGVVPAIVDSAELSFTRAKKILAQQQESYRGGRTIQASTALLQDIRVQRLTSYRLPKPLLEAGGHGKTVIWLSPEGQPFRVMSIRRNTHIDGDLVPIKGMTPVELVGKALQSALYWIAEDKKRQEGRKATTLYVGRIGRPQIAVAWAPNEPLTLEQVQKNLGRSIDGVSAARVVRLNGYSADQDIQSYVSALANLKQAPPQEAAPPPPPRAKPSKRMRSRVESPQGEPEREFFALAAQPGRRGREFVEEDIVEDIEEEPEGSSWIDDLEEEAEDLKGIFGR